MSIKQLTIFVENKQGAVVDITETLANHNVNIRALSIAETEAFGILRLIVNDEETAEKTLKEEIVPFVSDDVAATTVFAESITERFLNPYLNHLLVSISLNSISKWRARDLPSFKDYYERFGKIPERLTVGFSYLMATYMGLEKRGEEFFVKLPTREVEIKEDKPYLEYFAAKKPLLDFMKDVNVWGEDLTAYAGFADSVLQNIEKINAFDKLKFESQFHPISSGGCISYIEIY